jgi:hypothetical protein
MNPVNNNNGNPITNLDPSLFTPPTGPAAFWLLAGLLALLGVVLVILGVVLVSYKRWLDRDTRHKVKVEEQLGRIADLLERSAGRGAP